MTIDELSIKIRNMNSFGNTPRFYDEDTNSFIEIFPIVIRKDKSKNKAFVKTKTNPEGFFCYGNGEVEIMDTFELLERMPENLKDKWVMNAFGILK